MARLHERTGVLTSRTREGRAIVTFDSYDPTATRCCDHPDCGASPKRQDVVTFGLRVDDERAVEGVRVKTYWMRGDTAGGLAGEVV